MRMMHLTLPRGAVSYEQRRGRIDRYQSLLVRRRADELLAELPVGQTGSGNLMMRMFTYLKDHPEMHPNYDRTTGALGPGVKFCVSDFRQSQEWRWNAGRILA